MINLQTIYENKIALVVLGVVIKYLFDEFTRSKKKRKIIIDQFMPSLEFSFDKDGIKARLVGDYEITNLSDLPVRIQRPDLLGYNLANRAFQFKIRPDIDDFRSMFEPLKVAQNGECTLISANKCHIEIERCEVSRLPKYIWLETLEHMRLASNRKQRWIAYLYRRGFFDQNDARVWYQPTGKQYSSKTARLIALPGKLLHRRRHRRTLAETSEAPNSGRS